MLADGLTSVWPPGLRIGTRNSSTIARSSSASRPGKISRDVNMRTSHRALRSTAAGSSEGPSDTTNADPIALITSDCSAISAPIGASPAANHDCSAGLLRTRSSEARNPATRRSRGSSIPARCSTIRRCTS
jgi:hypothetical protein